MACHRMEVPTDPGLAAAPLELLLYLGLAIAGFILVVIVCALVLAIVHVALPDGRDPGDESPVDTPGDT